MYGLISLLVVVLLVAAYAYFRVEGMIGDPSFDDDVPGDISNVDSLTLLQNTPDYYVPGAFGKYTTSRSAGSDTFFQPYGQAVTPHTAAQDSRLVTAGANRYTSEPPMNTSPMFAYDDIGHGGGHDADYMIARMNVHSGAKAKKAIDGAVRGTANRFRRVFQNELDYNEKRVWWSSESQDDDMDFLPYNH